MAPYQYCLWERILATIVVVDAVVRDLFPDLTPNRAQDYDSARQAEQAQLGGGCVVVKDYVLVLDIVLDISVLGLAHLDSGYTK